LEDEVASVEFQRDDLVGGVFYEDGSFVREDAGGEVRGEGIDDGEVWRYDFVHIVYNFIEFSNVWFRKLAYKRH